MVLTAMWVMLVLAAVVLVIGIVAAAGAVVCWARCYGAAQDMQDAADEASRLLADLRGEHGKLAARRVVDMRPGLNRRGGLS